MMPELKQRGGSRWAAWMAGSVLVHLILAAVVTRIYLLEPSLEDAESTTYNLELAELPPLESSESPDQDQAAPLDSPELLVRLGDHDSGYYQRPADTLKEPLDRPGALAGKGEPRPLRDPLAGEDLDELRFLPFNHLSRQTPNRIRTGRRVVSPDNRRQTPNPRLSPHLVSGKGRGTWRTRGRSHKWRRKPNRSSTRAAASGQALDPSSLSESALSDAPGMERLLRRKRRGQLAPGFRRPELHRAPPTTLTRNIELDLADDRVRHQASRQRFPDLMDTARSRGKGRESGKGRGASAGRAGDPEGQPKGPPIWLNNPDNRYMRYFRRVHSKIDPLWAFPKQLEVLMAQGDVLVRFTIRADGAVVDIRVKKSSGYPRFDQMVVAAIRKAAPFGPIPAGLGQRVQVLAPFEFQNPLIR